MRAVVMLAAIEIRRRWRHVIVLTLLVGFAGAVVLALLAGARRTDTALARFEQESRAANLEVDVGDATPEQLARFGRTPGVEEVGQLYQLTLIAPGNRFLPTAGAVDERFGTVIDRPRLVDGRFADPAKADELTIGEGLADLLGLHVGDHVRFKTFSLEDAANTTGIPVPTGPNVSFDVVGIVRRPLDLGGRGANGGVVVPTPAFTERYRDRIASFGGFILRVRTTSDGDVQRVTRAARRIFGGSDQFSFTNLAVEGKGAQNAIDVTTVALLVAALVAGLASIVAVAIAMAREIALADRDQGTLRALGARPGQRVAAAAAIAVPIGVGGALLAVVGAFAASPLFPIGVAANAEPDPGARADPLVLVVGGFAVVLVVLAIAVVAATRTSRVVQVSAAPSRPGLTSRTVTDLGVAPPAAAGIRYALERGRARDALPVRSSLLGAAFGIVVVVAVMVFSAGLDHLLSTPAAYGWTWDQAVNDPSAQTREGADDCSPVVTELVSIRGLAAVTSVCNTNVEIEGRPVLAEGFGQLRGTIEPAIVEGRAPKTVHEISVGTDTLHAIGRHLGDRVKVTGSERTRTFRIVGRSVFAGLGDPVALAEGAVLTPAGLSNLGPVNGGWQLVVRYRPGADTEVVRRRLARLDTGDFPVPVLVMPAEIDRVRQIDNLPIAIAMFVAAVASVAVGFALVTGVRRRRRELAILRTVGLASRQLRSIVAWQATTVGLVALFIGVPIGLVIGRVTWAIVADRLGVATTPTWPVLAVVLLVPVVLLLVNLIAALPARSAARTHPAVVLRSE